MVNAVSQVRADDPLVGPTGPDEAPMEGESIGPEMALSIATSGFKTPTAPQSPYTARRALIRDMILPPIPNLDIPPSPPGSPRPEMDNKFAHFLELKKHGVHFNDKLARSSALKNPGLLQKLMGFAGLEEPDQYASTLAKEIWDPAGFPAWAYREELGKSQQEMQKRMEEEKTRVQRDAIDFVSATSSAQSSRGGTLASGGVSRGFRISAAERVMAGLDRERTRSPQVSDGPAQRVVGRQGGRTEIYQRESRARSRSPGGRKRSRSR